MQTIGTIDLGSNTFHLLIVEVAHGKIENILFRKRIFTRLGEGGQAYITNEALERALMALREFKSHLNAYHCDKISVIGTEAIRAAQNKQTFVKQAEEILGASIEIIDGRKEADLIFKGISLITDFSPDSNYLLVDIGGGSTELMLVKHSKLMQAQSFRLGVAVMHSMFHKEEPISENHLHQLESYIEKTIEPFIEQTEHLKINTMIGATGSFEVLELMDGKEISTHSNSQIDLVNCKQILDAIIVSNWEERKAMAKMPKERSLLIVVACVLIRKLLTTFNPEKLLVSPYALKEGKLFEMM